MENPEWVMPTHIVTAAGIVLNEKHEILLVRDDRRGWSFPGGQVENGENVIDAVIREVQEETGVDIEVEELFCISSNTSAYQGYNGVKEVPTKVMMDFICRATGGTPRPSEENAESVDVPQARVPEMIHAPAMLARYRAYLEYAGRPVYLAYVTKPEFELKLKRIL